MRYRLRPVRPRHRARVRLTLATLLLPLIAFVWLARSDAARSPLAEREASLAIGLQEQGGEHPEITHDPGHATALAVVAHLPRLVGNHELQLRLAGIAAGALALGLLTRLGTRLFAPRAGLAIALLLLALPTGRRLLGVELGVEPFYLASMAGALLAIRALPETRVAGVWTGIGCGLAIAFAGPFALWLPLLALAWLRVHQGLDRHSAGVVLGTTVVVAAIVLALAWLLFGRAAGEPLVPLDLGTMLSIDLVPLRAAPAAREMVPLVPLLLLGLWCMRSSWWRSDSFRFSFLWLVFGLASWALTGWAVGAYVAFLLLAASIALLGLEHARPLVSFPACGIALGLAVMLWQASPKKSEAQVLDRWAIREAGRFVGRVIAPDRRIAASRRAARRVAYYGNRSVETFTGGGDPVLAGSDYAILSRTDFQGLREHAASSGKGSERSAKRPPKRIAEFGNWVVVRLARPAA